MFEMPKSEIAFLFVLHELRLKDTYDSRSCVLLPRNSLTSPNMLDPSHPQLRTRIPRQTCRTALDCRNPTIIACSSVLADTVSADPAG